MTDVLIYGDTFRSPELRHEVPLGIPDPFLYVERNGARHIAIGAMEIPRLEALGLFELHPGEEFGSDDLIAEGLSYAEVRRETALRAVQKLGVTKRHGPGDLPALARRQAPWRRCRADHRRRLLRRSTPRQDRAAAGRDPPGPARCGGRDGRGPRPLPPGERERRWTAGRRHPADRRACESRDGRGVRRSTAPRPTTSSSRQDRRAPSDTTWAPGRFAPACRS